MSEEHGTKAKKLAEQFKAQENASKFIVEQLAGVQDQYHSLSISGDPHCLHVKFLGQSHGLKLNHDNDNVQLLDKSDKPIEVFKDLGDGLKPTKHHDFAESLGFILDSLI